MATNTSSAPGWARPRPPHGRLRIIVLGYLVRGPLGGMVTSNLQFLMGLHRLGHEVYFVEDSDDYPSCYNPLTYELSTDPTYGLRFAARAFERIGLPDRWTFYDAHTSRWLGACAPRILDVCATADLVLNLCGVNPLRPWLMQVPVRVLVDEDPAFTQIKHLTNAVARERALQHTAFFSFAENIGGRGSLIPDDGLPWQPTRQPIVLESWPVRAGPADAEFTTVMQWDSYPACEYEGVHYGLKSESFGAFLGLPARTSERLEVAVGGIPGFQAQRLREHGWLLRDPGPLSHDPWTYQDYLLQSKAELSVAKHGYVVSRSGWFSERSACYLAGGRPVVVQDTGFRNWLEVGSGVFAFTTPDDALAGIEEVARSYHRQCRAARAVAEEYFDSDRILADLLERSIAGSAPAGMAEGRVRGGSPATGTLRAGTS